jgi:peptide/nickel transport system substrate-binding protein
VWSDPPHSLDPAIGWDGSSWEALEMVFTPLLEFQGQYGQPAPSAARDMPEVSADGTILTVSLRPDVRFHNGRPVVADDYIYAWTRVLTAELASWASSYLLGIVGAQDYYDGKADSVSGLHAVDDHTLRITLGAPDLTFIGVLCQPYTAALPREVIEDIGDEAFARHPVGEGPYRATAWDDRNREARFERNPYYFWQGTPLLDQVTFRWGVVPELQVLQIQGGVADIAGDGLNANQAALLRSKGAAGERYTQSIPVLGVRWVAMNVAKGPLSDPAVRRALDLATDRQQLSRISFNTNDPWSLAFPKELPDYVRTATQVPFDPDEARRLLKKAGYTSSLRLDFLQGEDSPWSDFAQILQQQWAAIGVDIAIKSMGKAAFDTATTNQQGDLYGTRYFLGQPSGIDMVASCFVTGASMNYTGYSNKKVDDLTAAAKEAPTPQQSNIIVAQIEQLLRDDAAGIFVGNINFIAGRSPRLRNYQYRGEVGTYYDRLWVEKEHT